MMFDDWLMSKFSLNNIYLVIVLSIQYGLGQYGKNYSGKVIEWLDNNIIDSFFIFWKNLVFILLWNMIQLCVDFVY